MENFAKDKCYFYADYTKKCFHSRIYQLQDWYTTGMDGRQAIHLRDSLPYRIRLLTSEINPSGKNLIASASIARGAGLFSTAIQNGATGMWKKGTAPFISSLRLDFELWVKQAPKGDQIELRFFPVPVSQKDGGMMCNGYHH